MDYIISSQEDEFETPSESLTDKNLQAFGDLYDSHSLNAVSAVTAGGVESDTSEVIKSCICGGTVFSRDCIMCDSEQC